jgi:hypothetical protein
MKKCPLCSGNGPFYTNEEVVKMTKGAYQYDDVCIPCRKQIPVSKREGTIQK